MKVYFEQTGFGHGKVILKIYVLPRKDAHAYHFNADGSKSLFAWVNTTRAKVFESAALDSGLWYSIRHGLEFVEIDEEKENSWELSDLEYTPIINEEIEAYKKLSSSIRNVKTLDDFKALCPLIKKAKRVNAEIIKKLFDLVGQKPTPVINGEIGLAAFTDAMRFSEIMSELECK